MVDLRVSSKLVFLLYNSLTQLSAGFIFHLYKGASPIKVCLTPALLKGKQTAQTSNMANKGIV